MILPSLCSDKVLCARGLVHDLEEYSCSDSDEESISEGEVVCLCELCFELYTCSSVVSVE